MTRNEKSLQALFSGFYDPHRDPYEDDYMNPKYYNVITKNGEIVEEHLTYNRAYEIFNTNPGHYDIVEEIINSRRPIKSGFYEEIIAESKDGRYYIAKDNETRDYYLVWDGVVDRAVSFDSPYVDSILKGWKDLYEMHEFNIQSSRKPIKSTRVSDLSETERDRLYEIEKHEAEEYYNSLSDSDKQMLRLRYGIKNARDYVKFFVVHPNRLSEDYEYMIDPKEKLQSSRRPIKSSNNDLFNQIKDYLEGETVGKGVIRTRGNNLYFRSLIITVYKDGYIMRDDTHDKYFDGDTFEEFKDDYWEWVNPF